MANEISENAILKVTEKSREEESNAVKRIELEKHYKRAERKTGRTCIRTA